MITQKFEIRVALLGYVGVGKTTVLNATLRDKFSEVSMRRRTTAGINFFRIVSPAENAKATTDGESGRGGSTSSSQWSVVSDLETKPAAEVLQEIETSNQDLRGTGPIEEKWFNIELEEPLCEMRKDTSLVLVDVPGMNEADTTNNYTKYVEDNWKSFDCVVAVMDARQGVNTEEQLAFLKLIKKNLDSKKHVPTIILFNKAYLFDDAGQKTLLNEARKKIEKIFAEGKKVESGSFPVVLPISAIHAFFYRTASLLCRDDYKAKFGMDLIDKIGREGVGPSLWKMLAAEEKYKVVFKAVCDDSNYAKRLATTNFDKFLVALSLAVGGDAVQKKLLEMQIDVEIESLSLLGGECVTVSLLRTLRDKYAVLGKDPRSLKDTFWTVYEASRDCALSSFDVNSNILELAKSVHTLQSYCIFVVSVQWKDEEQLARAEACSLLRKQLEILIKKPNVKKSWELTRQICAECSASSAESDWDGLSSHDWLAILDSILLLSYDRVFCEVFGREKILLSQLRSRFVASLSAPIVCVCKQCQPDIMCFDQYGRTTKAIVKEKIPSPLCCKCEEVLPCSPCRKVSFGPLGDRELSFASGSFPAIGDQLNVMIPASLSSPSHWGHIAWKCCKLVDALDSGKVP